MTEQIQRYFDAGALDDPHYSDFEQARDLLEGTDWRLGLEKLERLAQDGSIMSTLLVAGCMLKGWGYDQDLPGAEAWYGVAAEAGFARGFFGLGLARLRMGRAIEAIEAFKVSVSKGYPPAYNALAYMYWRGGDGVLIDRRRASGLLRAGYELGHLASKAGFVMALLHGCAGMKGRFAGLLNSIPVAWEVARSKHDVIPVGSGDFHRVQRPLIGLPRAFASTVGSGFQL